MSEVRILVVEDQTVLRELLVALLDAEPGFRVVAEAHTTTEAVDALRRTPVDLVVLDLVLPDGSGLEVLETIRREFPRVCTVVVTGQDKKPAVMDAYRAGAQAIVTKQAALGELKTAIHRVLAGGVYYCAVTSAILHEAARTGHDEEVRLTRRERQIVQLVAMGKTSKEIATTLGISPKTIANHRFRISEKLGVRDVAGVVRYAIAQGWLVEGG
jgi:DNA-binding NarL/FixJ family response regulator